MATAPRRPQAQHHRDQLQQQRLRAAELFPPASTRPRSPGGSMSPARPSAAGMAAGRPAGRQRCAAAAPPVPPQRLSDDHLAQVERALKQGATANGFTGELWTLERIATVIERLTGVRHHPAHLWAILSYRLGWSLQRPRRLASERDQQAIKAWVAADWPRIKQTPNGAKPAWCSSTSPA